MHHSIPVLGRARLSGEKLFSKRKPPPEAHPTHRGAIKAFFARVFAEQLQAENGLLPQGLDVDVDLVEWTPQGPRIQYSSVTAGWLATVADDPSNKGAVTYHLNSQILNAGTHPLRRVLDALASLLSRLFVGAA
eukprot:267753-Prymnesium_polylepis.1